MRPEPRSEHRSVSRPAPPRVLSVFESPTGGALDVAPEGGGVMSDLFFINTQVAII